MKASSTSHIARFDTLISTVKLVTWIALIAFLLPGSIGRPADAAPPIQEDPPSRLPYDSIFDAPFLDKGAAPEETGPALTAPEYVNWSRLVFQSFRNQHDWEIFAARGDGSNQVNLSNNASIDSHPRLNRDGTRVVFASNRHGTFEIYAMNADGSGQTRLTNNTTDDAFPAWAPDGSKIAFQAYRDGQAEIYVMNANGSGQTRLTNHGEYDGQPAWSPDGAKIAFVRKQSGQYRIWVMNANGSNPQQRSGQPISEDPAWSPDGSKIAYDADGNNDGWQEIWLMDAGGGNQRPVYYPSQSNTDAWVYSWSPDGRYVAFTRISWVYQQGQWYWTRAYLDAWDSANPNDTIRLSNNGLDWYPDWRSLDWQAPLSQMQPLPAQSPNPFTVRWSGSDAGPAGLANYDVQVKDGAGGVWTNWHMATTTTAGSYSGAGGHTYYFRARARDNAGNVEAWPATQDAVTTVESLPPTSVVQPLPEYSPYGAAIMTWNGEDRGGSGIESFELQCRDGTAGVWLVCGTYQTPGSAPVPGVPGHTTFVRSRAIDKAGNIEPWPPGDGDAHTTIYACKVSGTVHDNGGAPVVGVTVTMTPTNFATVNGAADGSYEAYSAACLPWPDMVEMALSKTGYGALPKTRFADSSNPVLHGVLPPATHVVANWGFEQALLDPWAAGGSARPTLPGWAKHTGERGVVLGWPFTLTANVSHLPGTSVLPDATSDLDGGVHVTWIEDVYGVRYARRAPDGTWSEPDILASGPSGSPQVAVDQDGVVYVGWSERVLSEPDIFLRRRTQDGQWSAVVNVSSSPAYGSYGPLMDVDASGVVHVVWTEAVGGNKLYYSRRNTNGSWSPPTAISNPDPTGAGAFGPALAVHPQGEVDVAWTWGGGQQVVYAHRSLDDSWSPAQSIFNGDKPHLLAGPGGLLHLLCTGGDKILYASRPLTGPWSTSEVVIVPWPGYYTVIGDATVDQSGTVHLGLFGTSASNGYEVKYMRRDPSSNAWSQPELIAATPFVSADIRIGVDTTGTVYAAWKHRTDSWGYYYELLFSRRGAEGGWSSAIDLVDNTWQRVGDPLLTVDGHGRAHVLWSNEVWGGTDIFHALYVGTPPASDSWLRQQIAIPGTLSNPGLSFLYQLDQGNPDGRNPFSVTIQDGVSTTRVFTTTVVTTDWTHRWFDLSPWAGRTITVTFDVQNAADNSPAVVTLDEVTVGSTYPDLWVAKRGPSVRPNDPVVYTLTYGNRGGAAAANVRVTDSLPAGLVFVSAEPPPTSAGTQLTWDLGDLPANSGPFTITLTARASPPVSLGTVTNTVAIQSQSAELETHNNSALTTTFIGHRRFLPVIIRR